MKHTKKDLQDNIKKMQDIVDDPATSADIKAAIQPSLDKAKKLLQDMNAPRPAASKSVKTVISKTHKQKLTQYVKKNKELLAKYSGKTEKQLQADASRTAKRPGTRTSSSGKEYREYRANRTDITADAPHLESGGDLPDNPIWNNIGLKTPPQNFTPAATAAFTKAISYLEKEKEEGFDDFYENKAKPAIIKLVALVDEVLTNDGSQDPVTTHKLLQEIGIYNYKTGLLLDTDWLNEELAIRKLKGGGKTGKATAAPAPVRYVKRVSGQKEKGGPLNHIQSTFTIDDQTTYKGYHVPGEDWNGWDTPVFDKATAIKILKDRKVPYRVKGEKIEAVLDWHEDMPEEEYQYENLGPSLISVNGKKIKTYGVGAYSWIWSEVAEKKSLKEKGGTFDQQIKDQYAITNKIYPPKYSVIKLIGQEGYSHVKSFRKKSDAEDYVSNQNGAIVKYNMYKGGGKTVKATETPAPVRYVKRVSGQKARGGKISRNLSRDRKFKSNEPWEKKYKRKTAPKNPSYKKKNLPSRYKRFPSRHKKLSKKK